MNILRNILSVFWKLWFVIIFLITYVLLLPFFKVFLNDEKYFKKAIFTTKVWAISVLSSVGIFLDLKQESDLNENEAYIFCSNHTSYLDIILFHIILKNQFVFMGKKELGSTPIIKDFFKKLHILVDRKSQIASHRAYLKASEQIDKGISVIIFPEGTISREIPMMKPFKNGAFKMAMDKNIKIVPITFLNNWKLLQDAPLLKSRGGPGIARIIIHQPIDPKSFSGDDALEQLKSKVRSTIANELSVYYNKTIT